MNSAKEIASALGRTMRGPMWHGPSVLEALGGLTAERAGAHPISNAHSAWELVLHIAAWAEIAHARLHGTPWLEPTDAEDFPAPDHHGGASAWSAATQRAVTAYESLANAVRLLPTESLDALVDGPDYTRATMLRGVIEHGVYHAGQIVLLRKVTERV